MDGRSVDVTTCTFKLLSRNVIAEADAKFKLVLL